MQQTVVLRTWCAWNAYVLFTFFVANYSIFILQEIFQVSRRRNMSNFYLAADIFRVCGLAMLNSCLDGDNLAT
jgi:hypothetical protein